ncbi:MAG: hypothetical protein IPJ82_04110 [Lewinellaceae bacterium]|nr:hypothetical protein [Lewinellaceae bacterium]
MTQTEKSEYYPKVAPWDEPPSGGIIIHGKKTPDHEVIIDGFDPGRDKKTESDNRYQIWVAMPNSPLETREIIVSVNNTKTGQLEFEPLELHLNPSSDPINLIIMDVVMKNGNTITQPETNPSGQKPWDKDLGKNKTLKITVRDGASPDVVLDMTRIPNANGQKPVKFEVESNVPFDPKRGRENIGYHYIENSSRHIVVIARWDDAQDNCIIRVYTDNAATVTFT